MGLPGNQGHIGLQYGTAAAMSNGVVTAGPSGSQSHMFPQQSSSSQQSFTPPITNLEIPNIVPWFQYLDRDERRNNDGITFAPYGAALKAKGFLRISQLTSDFIRLPDLQEWLGVDVGTAIPSVKMSVTYLSMHVHKRSIPELKGVPLVGSP
jgi:hypothetical protein